MWLSVGGASEPIVFEPKYYYEAIGRGCRSHAEELIKNYPMAAGDFLGRRVTPSALCFFF